MSQPQADATTKPDNADSASIPPVIPVELRSDVEEGVLFSDPALTQWWWDSLAFLPQRQRYDILRPAVNQCTSIAARAVLQADLQDMDKHYAPVSAFDALVAQTLLFCKEHPTFAGLAALGTAVLSVRTGMGLLDFFTSLGR